MDVCRSEDEWASARASASASGSCLLRGDGAARVVLELVSVAVAVAWLATARVGRRSGARTAAAADRMSGAMTVDRDGGGQEKKTLRPGKTIV